MDGFCSVIYAKVNSRRKMLVVFANCSYLKLINKAYLRRNTLFFFFYRLSYDQQGRSQPLKAKRLVLLASKPYL